MEGSYIEQHEMKQFDEMVEYVAEDTIRCWLRMEFLGVSASMAADGNVSAPLMRILSKTLVSHIDEDSFY